MSVEYAGIPAVMPPARRRVLAGSEEPKAGQVSVPPLPAAARLPEGAGREASPWLDAYIAFSRKWSPRSFDGFHEACGLWLLSTVAARRVVLEMGKSFYTPLYIALVARTSLYAKSTAADIAIEVLTAAGLPWLLAADDSTPQKFIHDLTAFVPADFDQRHPLDQQRILHRLAVTGQRGWFYDEFGQHLDSISRAGGYMAEFRGLLRRFDDCKERFEYGTIGRGDDIVERPYLALLASMTPADLQAVAQHNASMWNDGFFARFAFVTPSGEAHERARFPTGTKLIPGALIKPMLHWHRRLGVAEVTIERKQAEEGKPAPKPHVVITPRDPVKCMLGDGVGEAFYRYHDALLDLVNAGSLTDLDGNYARMAEKALRIAILLGSLEHEDRIELRHWARAQEIAERWRAGLHALYEQASQPPVSGKALNEERVLTVVRQMEYASVREVQQRVRRLGTSEIYQLLESLVSSGALGKERHGRTLRYHIAD
ncbi:MAG: DUF3987 domain-containing protein [Armatimonadota bacterium]